MAWLKKYEEAFSLSHRRMSLDNRLRTGGGRAGDLASRLESFLAERQASSANNVPRDDILLLELKKVVATQEEIRHSITDMCTRQLETLTFLRSTMASVQDTVGKMYQNMNVEPRERSRKSETRQSTLRPSTWYVRGNTWWNVESENPRGSVTDPLDVPPAGKLENGVKSVRRAPVLDTLSSHALYGPPTSSPTLSGTTEGEKCMSISELDEDSMASSTDVPPGLPSQWPEVGLRFALTTIGRSGYGKSMSVENLTRRGTQDDFYTAGSGNSLDPEASWISRGMRVDRPDSTRHLVFKATSVLVLIMELSWITFLVAWDRPTTTLVYVSMWVGAIFWTFDMLTSFNTGYFRGNVLIMSRRAITVKYLQTWFSVDLMLVMCDWLIIGFAFVDTMRSLRLVRILKLSRLIRVAGMIRVGRLVRMFEDRIDMYTSGATVAVAKILAMFAVVLWLNHIIGCGWFALGRWWDSDTGTSWLDNTLGRPGQRYHELDEVFLYWTSFHWSMAQLTLGAVEISASNTAERIFSIALLLFGLLLQSTIVSSISATMIAFQMREAEKVKLNLTLERFLHQNGVAPGFSVLVQKAAEHRMKRLQMLAEDDVDALALLPRSLMGELRVRIYRAHVERYRLFSVVCSLSTSTAVELCQATRFELLRERDDLFRPGCVSEYFFGVLHGRILYKQEPKSACVLAPRSEVVNEGSWLCEACLFTNWIHVGLAEADTPCRFVSISTICVTTALKKERKIQQTAVAYAVAFYKRMCEAAPPLDEYPSDLRVPNTSFKEIVSSLSPDMRNAMLLQDIAKTHSLSIRTQTLLGKNVLDGTLGLQFDTSESTLALERVVEVQVFREDGRFLTEVASRTGEGNEWVPSCILPALKKILGETTSEAWDRMLDTKLHPLKGCVEIQINDVENEDFRSSHGVVTKSLRTLCLGVVTSPIKAQTYRPTMSKLKTWEALGNAAWISARNPARNHLNIQTVELYAFELQGVVTTYAWLSPSEFETLQACDGKFVTQWMSSVFLLPTADFTKPEVPEDTERFFDACPAEGCDWCHGFDASEAKDAPTFDSSRMRTTGDLSYAGGMFDGSSGMPHCSLLGDDAALSHSELEDAIHRSSSSPTLRAHTHPEQEDALVVRPSSPRPSLSVPGLHSTAPLARRTLAL